MTDTLWREPRVLHLEKYYSIYDSTPRVTSFIAENSNKGVITFSYFVPANSELSSGQFAAYKVKVCLDSECAISDKSDGFFKVIE